MNINYNEAIKEIIIKVEDINMGFHLIIPGATEYPSELFSNSATVPFIKFRNKQELRYFVEALSGFIEDCEKREI